MPALVYCAVSRPATSQRPTADISQSLRHTHTCTYTHTHGEELQAAAMRDKARGGGPDGGDKGYFIRPFAPAEPIIRGELFRGSSASS